MSDDREWGTYRSFSFIASIISLIFLVVFLFTSTTDYEGFTERLLVAACLIWIEITGLKLYVVSKSIPKQIPAKLNQ